MRYLLAGKITEETEKALNELGCGVIQHVERDAYGGEELWIVDWYCRWQNELLDIYAKHYNYDTGYMEGDDVLLKQVKDLPIGYLERAFSLTDFDMLEDFSKYSLGEKLYMSDAEDETAYMEKIEVDREQAVRWHTSGGHVATFVLAKDGWLVAVEAQPHRFGFVMNLSQALDLHEAFAGTEE